MTILVQQLRDRALKATPGPWQHERLGIIQGGPMQTYVNGQAMPQLFTSHGADFMEPGDYLANADFVAAANPATVLALLDELDQLKAENQELKSAKHTLECRFEVSEDTLSTIRGCLRAAEGDVDQLKAENAELKRDAERYRYLRDGACTVATSQRKLILIEDMEAIPGDFANGGEMLDAAIDQAMTKEQQP